MGFKSFVKKAVTAPIKAAKFIAKKDPLTKAIIKHDPIAKSIAGSPPKQEKKKPQLGMRAPARAPMAMTNKMGGDI